MRRAVDILSLRLIDTLIHNNPIVFIFIRRIHNVRK